MRIAHILLAMTTVSEHRDGKAKAADGGRTPRVAAHFWSWGALLLALTLAAAGTSGIGFALRASGGTNHGLLVASIFVVLVGFILNVANQVRNKRQARADEQRRTKHLTRFNDELSSVLQVVVELLESDQDEQSSARFFSSAIREARHLVSYDGVRICVYRLEAAERDETKDGEQDIEFLHLQAFGGRGDHPRAEFRADTLHGAAVVETAKGNIAVPISDYEAAEREIDRPEHAVWSSTLLVPLKDGTDALGVLMIDTRDTVTFTPEDISVGWTIATLVALGMRALAEGSGNIRPEVDSIMDLFE